MKKFTLNNILYVFDILLAFAFILFDFFVTAGAVFSANILIIILTIILLCILKYFVFFVIGTIRNINKNLQKDILFNKIYVITKIIVWILDCFLCSVFAAMFLFENEIIKENSIIGWFGIFVIFKILILDKLNFINENFLFKIFTDKDSELKKLD